MPESSHLLAHLTATLTRLPERTEIDWFEGGHEIDLEPALQFFDRFLQKP